jgi:hypothetical protein
MVLCTCLCVCIFSLRRESPDWSWCNEPLISEVVLSHMLDCLLKSKHLTCMIVSNVGKILCISFYLEWPECLQMTEVAFHCAKDASENIGVLYQWVFVFRFLKTALGTSDIDFHIADLLPMDISMFFKWSVYNLLGSKCINFLLLRMNEPSNSSTIFLHYWEQGWSSMLRRHCNLTSKKE